jgi:serine/threonine protein phosphatase PrpC
MQVIAYSTGADARNEDCELHDEAPVDGVWRCVLADGQGGRSGGQTAARTACHATWQALAALSPRDRSSPSSVCGALVAADRAVCAEPTAGFTTLIGLLVEDGWLCGASNGDSLVLLLDQGTVIDLTRGQAKNPPVGSGNADIRPIGFALTEPWALLVASDGVWKYVGLDTLAALLRDHRGQDLLDHALAAARLPGSARLQDDFTLVWASSQ